MMRRANTVVRAATPDDLPDVLRLVTLMHDDEPLEPCIVSSNGLADIFKNILADPRRRLVVATIGGVVVGTADLVIVINVSRGGRSWATVENVVVDPPYRRHGVARTMMQYLMREASDSGCYKVQLISHARRTEAHHLYESLGFDAPVRGFRKYSS
jgi:GNAT superfamily N-acetyltransferase